MTLRRHTDVAWQLIDDEAVAAVVERFAAEQSRARRDVRGFLSRLPERRLEVEVSPRT